MQTTFFYLGKFLKKLADDQCSSMTKGSIYHINHMYMQPFTTNVDWPEIGCLMEVSTLLYICRYCVFTWDGRCQCSFKDCLKSLTLEKILWRLSLFSTIFLFMCHGTTAPITLGSSWSMSYTFYVHLQTGWRVSYTWKDTLTSFVSVPFFLFMCHGTTNHVWIFQNTS